MALRCFLYMGVLTGLLAGCGGAFTPADEAAIRSVMEAQQRAWDRGDIPAFMEGYVDSVCFISRTGRTCGKAEVMARYQRSYPDKAAMGRLTFGSLEVLGAGTDNAWCTGTWRLVRAQDTLGGGFSLFWQRSPAGWRILRDHTY
ncbi:MAG: nuclear transport factor 2 family protein [Flavobacteriales bacterium]